MLVLSRRPGQRIHFPTLGITIQVLQAGRAPVRLGIDAPPDVRIFREELTGPAPPCPSPAPALSHDQRGRLNTAMVALYLAEKQVQAGRSEDAEVAIREALRCLDEFDQDRRAPATAPRPVPIEALLVEDDRNEQALLASYLRLNGIHTATAVDGEEALEFLSSHARPDFVLLDMRLPRRDGPATVAAIRQNEAYRGLRIFGVSGTTPEELGVPTGPGGVDCWFRKPLCPDRLVEAMNAACRRN